MILYLCIFFNSLLLNVKIFAEKTISSKMQRSFGALTSVVTHWEVLAFPTRWVFWPCFHLCSEVALIFVGSINHSGMLQFQSAGSVSVAPVRCGSYLFRICLPEL